MSRTPRTGFERAFETTLINGVAGNGAAIASMAKAKNYISSI